MGNWAAWACLASYSDLRTATSSFAIPKAAMGLPCLLCLCPKMRMVRELSSSFLWMCTEVLWQKHCRDGELKCPHQFKGLQQGSLKTHYRDLLSICLLLTAFASFKYHSLISLLQMFRERSNTAPCAAPKMCKLSWPNGLARSQWGTCCKKTNKKIYRTQTYIRLKIAGMSAVGAVICNSYQDTGS